MGNSIRDGQDIMVHMVYALDLLGKMPASRELSLMRTKLEEAIMWGNRALCGLQYTINDQPAATERLAQWMMQHSFATGHGDTMDDLLGELSRHVSELRAKS